MPILHRALARSGRPSLDGPGIQCTRPLWGYRQWCASDTHQEIHHTADRSWGAKDQQVWVVAATNKQRQKLRRHGPCLSAAGAQRIRQIDDKFLAHRICRVADPHRVGRGAIKLAMPAHQAGWGCAPRAGRRPGTSASWCAPPSRARRSGRPPAP